MTIAERRGVDIMADRPDRRLRRMFRGLTVCAGLLALTLGAGEARADRFSFVVFGDTQDTSDKGIAGLRKLITQINGHKPRFTVHIGDIKGGGPCSDTFFYEMRAILSEIDGPFVYLPGDNEWTDCYRPEYGSGDPILRLNALRRTFFRAGRSLGSRPLKLDQQWTLAEPEPDEDAQDEASFDQPDLARLPVRDRKFIENARWIEGGVVFATFHLVGSNNNLRQDADAIREHLERDMANLAWLEAAFDEATDRNAPALVILFHANPAWNQPWWQPTGFDRFRESLVAQTAEYGRPVLVVHGDTHTFRIDKPVKYEGRTLENLTRLEVFGPPDLGAIEVQVNTRTKAVFSFEPFNADGKAQ